MADFERAATFYEAILATSLIKDNFGPDRIGVFPYSEPAIGGCILKGDRLRPGPDGVVIYLNADPSLDAVLARIEPSGGRILVARTALPEGMGFYAHILDTEGNRVGLHAIA